MTTETLTVRPLDTQDVFDALNEAVGHLKRNPSCPATHSTDDIPMLADLIRIVMDQQGVVICDDLPN